jgi:hypothetical protein
MVKNIVLTLFKGGYKVKASSHFFVWSNNFFCKVSCTYMLLTCHKINNIPNFQLNFDCELE